MIIYSLWQVPTYNVVCISSNTADNFYQFLNHHNNLSTMYTYVVTKGTIKRANPMLVTYSLWQVPTYS